MTAAGIIFSNLHDKNIAELTQKRTMASVPFGGRYRLIDFALSNMVNSDITTVGLITHNNYQSLLDHIGTGKDWDLARRSGGIKILPPYITAYANAVLVGEVDDTACQQVAVRTFLDAGDEGPLNLDFVAGDFLEHCEVGVALTKVVKGNVDACRLPRFRGGYNLLNVFYLNGFGKLYRQRVRGKVGFFVNVNNRFDGVGVGELT